MAVVYPNTNDRVAHLPGVKRTVRNELRARAARVEAVVQAHRLTGELARGTGVRTGRTDSTVYMEHEAVHAINYGHVNHWDGSWVPGIHAIEAAL